MLWLYWVDWICLIKTHETLSSCVRSRSSTKIVRQLSMFNTINVKYVKTDAWTHLNVFADVVLPSKFKLDYAGTYLEQHSWLN